MARWLAKLLALLLIFVVVLFFTLLPIKVKGIVERWGTKGQRIIGYFMCFGGGVFLSIYMLHMAPDARELVTKEIVEPNNIEYPLAELIPGIGFFLMLCSESFVLYMYGHWVSKEHKIVRMKSKNDDIGEKLSGEGLIQTDSHLSLEDNLNQPDEVAHKKKKTKHEKTKHEEFHLQVEEKTMTQEIDLTGSRSLILLLALSLHHIFEGMSVGLKRSNTAVWSLTVAILTHEVVIAFSLGLQLVKAYKTTLRVVIAGLLCTLMVPLGITIGLALSETNNGEMPSIRIANGILQSLATGVFIYVTFFEILAGELTGQRVSLKKLLSMTLGFVIMALLALIPEDKETDFILESHTNSTGMN